MIDQPLKVFRSRDRCQNLRRDIIDLADQRTLGCRQRLDEKCKRVAHDTGQKLVALFDLATRDSRFFKKQSANTVARRIVKILEIVEVNQNQRGLARRIDRKSTRLNSSHS